MDMKADTNVPEELALKTEAVLSSETLLSAYKSTALLSRRPTSTSSPP
jgi:hypothetical protein